MNILLWAVAGLAVLGTLLFSAWRDARKRVKEAERKNKQYAQQAKLIKSTLRKSQNIRIEQQRTEGKIDNDKDILSRANNLFP